ncbi:MAG: hypothetical protein WBC78_26620 [Candidatus Sulfotelmatobacter sp.]
MTAKKKRSKKEHREREPLLNAVARKLGHAAGTFSKATQEFAEAFSAMPVAVTAKVPDAALFGTSTDTAGSRPRTKKSSTAGRNRRMNKKASAGKRAPSARHSPSGRKSTKKKTK